MKKISFEEYLSQHYSSTAIRGYSQMIQRFQMQIRSASTAKASEVMDYLASLRQQGLSPKTLRNHLFALKIWFRYLREIGEREDHPCQHIQLKDAIDRQVAVESLYSRKLLDELYENYQCKDPKHQHRNQAIVSLLVFQALTVLEIIQLKTSAIDWEKGTVTLPDNAKNKGRTLQLKAEQLALFQTYEQRHRPQYLRENESPCFFLSNEGKALWNGAIGRILNQNKNHQTKRSPLKIRQSVIAHLLKDHNLRVVQEFAGHRKISSTEAYQQSDWQELRTQVGKFHPLG